MLIGSDIIINTQNNTIEVDETEFVEQGFSMELSYDSNVTVNTSGNFIQRGSLTLLHTFSLNLVLTASVANTLLRDYDDLNSKLKSNTATVTWNLVNNRMKTVSDGLSGLAFSSHSVHPVEITVKEINNDYSEVNLTLQEIKT